MNFDKFLESLSLDEIVDLQSAIGKHFGRNWQKLNSTEMVMILKGQIVDAARHVRNRLNIPLREAHAIVTAFREMK